MSNYTHVLRVGAAAHDVVREEAEATGKSKYEVADRLLRKAAAPLTDHALKLLKEYAAQSKQPLDAALENLVTVAVGRLAALKRYGSKAKRKK